jgi:hypothetical protein
LSNPTFRLLSGLVIVVIVLAAVIAVGRQGKPTEETAGREHCFAEWCIAPQATTMSVQTVTVGVKVRSDAKQASQKPDHPQAWVIDAAGRQFGGPQHSLDRTLAAGDSYTTTLTFSVSQPGACPSLLVSEGAWPTFLGLGYAASPFTAKVQWRLCEIAG